MAKYFLGSVGKAEAFRKNVEEDKLELVFVSKTLTDSGLNISTTKDDIRAGQGAPIQFSFYHDPSVEITLTDVLWKPEYLSAQLGAEFEDGAEDYITKEVDFTNGEASFTETVNKAPIPCGEDYLIWAAKSGTDEWELVSYDANAHKLLLDKANGKYCVRYLGAVSNARQAEINSLIIPQELFLIITAPIFAGDACSASNGKAAGHITFEVPRFQLNGAQEFAMNMSQNQTMSLAGIALASESADCDAVGGKLLRIIEVIDNRDWRDNVVGILVDGEYSVAGEKPVLYAELKDGKIRKLAADEVEYRTALESDNLPDDYTGLVASYEYVGGNKYEFRVKGTTIVSEIVHIAAAE